MENTVRHQRPSLTPGPNDRLSFDACAGTNVGLVRTVNEDAVLDFSEIGLWAVADGCRRRRRRRREAALSVAAFPREATPAAAARLW
jgi:hypothetical protein